MNNNAACHLYGAVLNCTVTCNLQPIVGHFVIMTMRDCLACEICSELVYHTVFLTHCSRQPLQITAGIKRRARCPRLLVSLLFGSLPPTSSILGKRPSFVLDNPPLLCLHFSFSHSVFTWGGWGSGGIVYVWRTLWYTSSHLLSLFCLSLSLCLSAFPSLGHQSMYPSRSSGCHSGPPKYFRCYAVSPTHRHNYIKPCSKIHNWKGQAIKNCLCKDMVGITGDVAQSSVHTIIY